MLGSTYDCYSCNVTFFSFWCCFLFQKAQPIAISALCGKVSLGWDLDCCEDRRSNFQNMVYSACVPSLYFLFSFTSYSTKCSKGRQWGNKNMCLLVISILLTVSDRVCHRARWSPDPWCWDGYFGIWNFSWRNPDMGLAYSVTPTGTVERIVSWSSPHREGTQRPRPFRRYRSEMWYS